jgi:hypothetical protein
MPKLMHPRQTLSGCARIQARFLSTKLNVVASNFLKAQLAEMRTVVSTSYARGMICPRKGSS